MLLNVQNYLQNIDINEYEEFVELGDYFVIGKDGLVYVKHGLNFENMFREKENV